MKKQCKAVSHAGRRCKRFAVLNGYCNYHLNGDYIHKQERSGPVEIVCNECNGEKVEGAMEILCDKHWEKKFGKTNNSIILEENE